MTYVVKWVIKWKEKAHARSKITDLEEGDDDYKCLGLLLSMIIKRLNNCLDEGWGKNDKNSIFLTDSSLQSSLDEQYKINKLNKRNQKIKIGIRSKISRVPSKDNHNPC